MKLAVAIIIVAMVARAQGIRCAVCIEQPGEEIINVGEYSDGAYTDQDCETTSVVECEYDHQYQGDPDVCATLFMTFTTTVDGKPKEEYTNFFHCNHKKVSETEEDGIERCQDMEDYKYTIDEGITDFACRYEACEIDGCNYPKQEEKESDAESYVSSETRAGTSIFLVGILSFLI